jgi:hypothetical protein
MFLVTAYKIESVLSVCALIFIKISENFIVIVFYDRLFSRFINGESYLKSRFKKTHKN